METLPLRREVRSPLRPLQLTVLVKDDQLQDPELAKISEHIAERPDFRIVDGILYYQDRLCVPNIEDLKNDIMTEAHSTKYSMHPGNPIKLHHIVLL